MEELTTDSNYSMLQIRNYEELFNVDTEIVLARINLCLIPFKADSFYQEKPDLYGPIWISSTLIFILNIISHVSLLMEGQEQFDFGNLLLSTALIYLLVFGLPLLVQFIVSFSDSNLTRMKAIGIYGYSFTAFIPALALCAIDYEVLRWALCICAVLLGWMVLYNNFWKDIPGSMLPKIFVVGIGGIGHLVLAFLAKLVYINK